MFLRPKGEREKMGTVLKALMLVLVTALSLFEVVENETKVK